MRQEFVLQHAVRAALQLLAHKTDATILLGLEPEEADPELGYIIPGECDGYGRRSIRRFIEKPSASRASEIIGQGGLWNTFIIVASGQGLLNLFEQPYPNSLRLVRVPRLTRGWPASTMVPATRLFSNRLDFSVSTMVGRRR